MVCDQLKITYSDVASWSQMSKWERAHWVKYHRIKPWVETYFQTFANEEPPGTIQDFINMDPDKRAAAIEYDHHKDEMDTLKITRTDWMNASPEERTMRLNFARQAKAKGHV